MGIFLRFMFCEDVFKSTHLKSDLLSTRPWKMFHAQNCPKIFPTSYIYVLHCHMTLSRQKNCKHIIFWKRNEKKKIMYGCKRHRWDFTLIGSESHWERKFTDIQLDIGLFRAKIINVYGLTGNIASISMQM